MSLENKMSTILDCLFCWCIPANYLNFWSKVLPMMAQCHVHWPGVWSDDQRLVTIILITCLCNVFISRDTSSPTIHKDTNLVDMAHSHRGPAQQQINCGLTSQTLAHS